MQKANTKNNKLGSDSQQVSELWLGLMVLLNLLILAKAILLSI